MIAPAVGVPPVRFFLMKTDNKYKQARLYEYKVVYEANSSRLGEHYYMCETAAQALSSHSGVCLHHDRHLFIKAVHKRNPWTNQWENETADNTNLIHRFNQRL